MKSLVVTFILSFTLIYPVFTQQERKLVRDGVREYEKNKFSEAEISFRKALDKNQDSYAAEYNIGNSLYKQNKYKEATEQFDDLRKKEPGNEGLADLYHNIGNSFLEQQQYDKSIEAYKNSLRLRPTDEETRYNLAYAMLKLKEQEQNQDKKNEQENKDQDQQQDQNKKEENKENQEQEQQQQQQQQDNLTKQEAEQILQAIQNQEKQVQEKVDLKKARAAKISNQKDW